MTRSARMVLLTFLESFASVLVQRGLYFHCRHRLGFTDADNLLLALVFGLAYLAGAVGSHRLARRWKEKHLMAATILAQVPLHLLLGLWISAPVMFAAAAVLGLVNGCKWPLIESYVSAGAGPKDTSRAIGRFNLAWATACPASLVVAGPIIAAWDGGLFLTGAAVNVAALLLVLPLPASPPYLPAGHPDRPDEAAIRQMRRLLAASRWLMVLSYMSMRILTPLLPRILSDLSVPVQWATGLVAALDLGRLAAFAVFHRWAGWHGRVWAVAVMLVALPAGFFMAIFSPNLAAAFAPGSGVVLLLAGEVLFGVGMGMTYYAALYYAMAAQNASVAAGGMHEAMIGSGFVLGPAGALAGVALAPVMGGQVLGTTVGVAPVMLVCMAGAAWMLFRPRGG